ncbi:hypothetical protein PT088_07485 [Erysipelothrix rhusiopathiae]|nr:hypothetical protein [Erysipelothrix rhusiopathiae]MDE8037321.1 hypothetical protein [Erysipelothrix rhusiopathiae]MDE8044389.1 hypothetical protein [Erysipelothrix rhusiopathiae]MDE8057283.1 hypothetical protein [Erysipelothrix rhusiopathiae]MDE8059834.1 hypothetical protein [Erysipelothrix rhusiopathiae]
MNNDSIYIEIREQYEQLLDIYNQELNNLKTDEAKYLLENSILLSIFTKLEEFLKVMISNYIEQQDGLIMFEHLDESITKKLIYRDGSLLVKNKKDFDYVYKLHNSPLQEKKLKEFFKFKFIHKGVLKSHYGIMFKQIFNDQYILDKMKITVTSESTGIMQVDTRRATEYIEEYVDKVRNEIAHDCINYVYETATNKPIEDEIKMFLQIIENLCIEYKKIYGVEIKKVTKVENVLNLNS